MRSESSDKVSEARKRLERVATEMGLGASADELDRFALILVGLEEEEKRPDEGSH